MTFYPPLAVKKAFIRKIPPAPFSKGGERISPAGGGQRGWIVF